MSMLLVLVVLGFFSELTPSVYLASLFVGLLESGIAFFWVVSSLLAELGP